MKKTTTDVSDIMRRIAKEVAAPLEERIKKLESAAFGDRPLSTPAPKGTEQASGFRTDKSHE